MSKITFLKTDRSNINSVLSIGTFFVLIFDKLIFILFFFNLNSFIIPIHECSN